MDPLHPKRSPFFAARVIRLMTKTAAAQEIGTSAFALVCIVGMQEDTKAVRYSRPVTYFNDQLMSLLGVNSRAALERARSKAVQAGWLNYIPGGKGRPGKYWIGIPQHLEAIPDSACDEGTLFPIEGFCPPENGRENSNEEGFPGRLRTGNGEANELYRNLPVRKRTGSGEETAHHSYLEPIPKDKTHSLPPSSPPEKNGRGEGEEGAQMDLLVDAFSHATELDPLRSADELRKLEADFLTAWNATDGVQAYHRSELSEHRRRQLFERVRDPAWDWLAALGHFPLKHFGNSESGWKPTIGKFLESPDFVFNILEGRYDRPNLAKHSRGPDNGRGTRYTKPTADSADNEF